MERPMENKKDAMLKMRQMSIEEKIALLSETDEAYIRGFIEGTIFWSYQTSKQNGNDKGTTKPKSPKAGHKS
jgi:hypothetical protein